MHEDEKGLMVCAIMFVALSSASIAVVILVAKVFCGLISSIWEL